jgi:hypothetical protein
MEQLGKSSKIYITNLNTFSTLVDRLCIENVKMSHFEFLIEQNEINTSQSGSLSRDQLLQKISIQREMISVIKEEIVNLLSIILEEGSYEYLDESRTFRAPK